MLLLLVSALPAVARNHRSEAWARARYAAAEQMQDALNEHPASERTRRDYQKVISAYREIYFGAPTSTKADPSAAEVARLQLEMGRRFNDARILRLAAAQFQFLRREYPGSSARFEALYTIGQIYRDDLNEPAKAHAAFAELVRRYPRHKLAEDARKALADEGTAQVAEKPKNAKRPQETQETQESKDKNEDGPGDSAGKAASTKEAQSPAASAAGADGEEKTDGKSNAPQTDEDAHPATTVDVKLARVTGIRHWSTPDYTRVAIDLAQTDPEHDVAFQSQRIDHPDRIFFDLPDTKLASRLAGKTFDVDDGLLKKIRVAQFQPGRTRIVLDVDSLSDYKAFLLPNPSRLIIDVHGKDTQAKDEHSKDEPGKSPAADQSEAKAGAPTTAPNAGTDKPTIGSGAPTVEAAAGDGQDSDSTVVASDVHVTKKGARKKIVDTDDDDDDGPSPTASLPTAKPGSKRGITAASKRSKVRTAKNVHEAAPNSSGDRSLIRALGLKIGKIVIDPGHGGHDTGTIGPNGFQEKTLVLDVSKRLGKLLESRMGAEVAYTRRDDTFIPLETRTAIANQAQADLFVSIHANASRDPDARGVETYYLNFTSSPDALEVAARENAVSEESIYQLQDLVKKIALKEKIDESREFASDVQESLHSGLAAKSPSIRDRGVKKAPFIVLIGANMPSILAEISFVSNPEDERRLRTPEYRQKIAESLYRGIAKYVSGLSGVKVASKIDKSTGQ